MAKKKAGGQPGPRKYDPAKHCGAPAKSKGKRPCTRGKGERTDHPGSGRCWIHGGRNKKTHGLYSTVKNKNITDIIAQIQTSGVDVKDLQPEAELLKAIIVDYVNRHTAQNEALAAWYQSFSPALTVLLTCKPEDAEKIVRAIEDLRNSINVRPKELPDLSNVSVLVERLGRLVKTIHDVKRTTSITYEAVMILQERMAHVLLTHLKGKTAVIGNEVIRAIQKDWDEIDIPLNTQG